MEIKSQRQEALELFEQYEDIFKNNEAMRNLLQNYLSGAEALSAVKFILSENYIEF